MDLRATEFKCVKVAALRGSDAVKIPLDWIVEPLSALVTFLDGKRRPVKDSDRARMQGEIPYYRASGIVDFVGSYLFDEDLILLG